MKHILITGAAGLIGSGLRENLKGRYKLRLTDIKTPDDLAEDEEFLDADCRRRDFVAEECLADEVLSQHQGRRVDPAAATLPTGHIGWSE